MRTTFKTQVKRIINYFTCEFLPIDKPKNSWKNYSWKYWQLVFLFFFLPNPRSISRHFTKSFDSTPVKPENAEICARIWELILNRCFTEKTKAETNVGWKTIFPEKNLKNPENNLKCSPTPKPPESSFFLFVICLISACFVVFCREKLLGEKYLGNFPSSFKKLRSKSNKN